LPKHRVPSMSRMRENRDRFTTPCCLGDGDSDSHRGLETPVSFFPNCNEIGTSARTDTVVSALLICLRNVAGLVHSQKDDIDGHCQLGEIPFLVVKWQRAKHSEVQQASPVDVLGNSYHPQKDLVIRQNFFIDGRRFSVCACLF
jgi:hypothetical protein